MAQDPARTLFDYFERIDAQDPAGAVANFTEDATAEVMTGKFLEGRDRIGRALGRILVAYERTSHHATNLRWDEDGDGRITLWSYVYAYHGANAFPEPHHLAIAASKHLSEARILAREHLLRRRLAEYAPPLPFVVVPCGVTPIGIGVQGNGPVAR